MKHLQYRILPVFSVFISGGAVMSLEMLGSRLITPVVGATINVWTALISVFLAGIALGYSLGDKIADKELSLKFLGGLFIAAAFFISQISWANTLLNKSFSETTLPYWLVSFVYTALLLLVPAVLLGAITLYTIRLSLEGSKKPGRVNGMLYAVSTIGSLFGIILTSFYLVPFFSINVILFFLFGALFFFGVAVLITWLVC